MRGKQHLSRVGFTLIELLVVIAIIAVLIALLLPAVQKVREAANMTKCQNNMKQLGMASQTYADANGYIPVFVPNGMAGTINCPPDAHIAVLPFLEQNALYQPIMTQFTTPGANWTLVGGSPSVFICPSDPAIPASGIILDPVQPSNTPGVTDANPNVLGGAACGLTSYLFNNDGVWGLPIVAVTDGTSNTILFGETCNSQPNWSPSWTAAFQAAYSDYPANYPYVLYHSCWWPYPTGSQPLANTQNIPLNYPLPTATAFFSTTPFLPAYGSSHTGGGGGANFVFCDGSVHFISNAINSNPAVLYWLDTPAGGEVIPADTF